MTKFPFVNVPVLSKANVLARLKFSKYVEPLIKMPNLAALPIEIKNDRGTDITIAHGQLTTKKFNALAIHVYASLVIKDPIKARSTAEMTTEGVYHLANLVINFSCFDLTLVEFSTNSKILFTVESS